MHKPKTIEDIADSWAKTPEQEMTLSKSLTHCLKSQRMMREISKNELAPSVARKDLEHLSKMLRRAEAALGRRKKNVNSAVNALLRQEHLELQRRLSEDANKQRDDANKQWREIEKRFWNDIEAISRLYGLATSAVNEQVPIEKQDATRNKRPGKTGGNKQPWLPLLFTHAESMWRHDLGRPRLGEPFRKFYNELCGLAGEKPATEHTFKERRRAWRRWQADLRSESVGRLG
jgi:hypothetical protein